MISITLDIDQIDEIVYQALEELDGFLKDDEMYVDEDQREKLKEAVTVLIDWFKVPEVK